MGNDPKKSCHGRLTAASSESDDDTADEKEFWTESSTEADDGQPPADERIDTSCEEGYSPPATNEARDASYDSDGLCPGLLSASDSEDSSSDEESGDGSHEDARPTVKKRKIAVKEHLTATTLPKLAPDGLVYATEESWQRVRTTVYVANPDHKETIVSSAAIHGLCDEMVKTKSSALPAARDEIMRALKVTRMVHTHHTRTKIRILQGNTDELAKKFIVLREATVLIIDSDVPLVLMGRDALEEIQMRTDENLEMSSSRKAAEEDNEEIIRLLEERLDEAKSNGLTEWEVKELASMVLTRHFDVFRLRLTPGESASVPPLEVQLQPNAPPPPRPYQRRYSKEETEFFIEETAKLEAAGVIRRSKSPHLLPCNLVKKKKGPITLAGQYRLILDARHTNKHTVQDYYLIPRLEDIVSHLVGSNSYAMFDALKGYWQFMLHEDSRKYFAFISPCGAWEYLRVPMGAINSAPHFQRAMEEVVGDLLYNGLLQYVDDTLIYARNFKEHYMRLEQFFLRLKMFNVKIHPGKMCLYAKKLVWGGRELSAKGQTVDPARVQTMRTMSPPTRLDELMTFVYSANWHRKHIPDFAKIAAPCYDLIKETLKDKKYATKSAAKKFDLVDLPEWAAKAKQSYDNIREAMMNAVVTAFFDREQLTCVFTDASDDFWGMVITQIPPEEEGLPVHEQTHKPLAFVSGRFRGAQTRWAIIDKEAYPIGEILPRYVHWINAGTKPALIWTDHRNLVPMFKDSKPSQATTKAGRQRLVRWGLQLQELRYKIMHIAGEANTWADLLSRWGSPFKKPLTQPRRIMVLRRRPPDKSAEWQDPDRSVEQNLLQPWPEPIKAWPDEQMLADLQRSTQMDTPNGVTEYSRPWGSVYLNEDLKFWVPEDCEQLQRVLYSVAHQGASGHRGRRVTVKTLKDFCAWKNVEDAVKKYRRNCLQCIKLMDGTTVPRPLGTQLVPEKPGEVVSFDYLYIGASKSGYKYILILVDKFSRVVRLIATIGPTAIPTAKALLQWATDYGLPTWLISDGGSHFKNQVLEHLAQRLGMKHHIVTAYCPWANGAVENVCKQVLWVLRALTSELQLDLKDWEYLLPFVNFVLNHRNLETLGGYTPLEVMTGRPPTLPLNLVLWKGLKIKDAERIEAPLELINEYMDGVVEAVAMLHDVVTTKQNKDYLYKLAKKKNKGKKLPLFNVGDFVMICTTEKKKHKLSTVWQGPMEIVGTKSDFVYTVRMIGTTNKPIEVHVARMKRFAGKEFFCNPELVHSAQHDAGTFEVEDIIDWRIGDSHEAELLIHWKGWEESDRTWESAMSLYEDIPNTVLNYLRSHATESDVIDDLVATLDKSD